MLGTGKDEGLARGAARGGVWPDFGEPVGERASGWQDTCPCWHYSC